MAWNRSDGQSGLQRQASKPKIGWRKVGLTSVLALGALAIVLYFTFGGSSQSEESSGGKNRKIADVAPHKKPTSPKVDSAASTPSVAAEAPKKMWYDADTNSAAYKVYHHKGPVITNSFAYKTQSLSARTFKYTSDKIIGQLLSVSPGSSLFGDVKYDERFVRRFLDSLKEPIVIEREDSEEVKALKEAVIGARKDLKAAYDRGEDIAQIMTDTRKELKELGAYRDELQKQVNDIIRRDYKKFTAQDLEDCIGAANKMLADRGCKPMAMPAFMRHRLKVLQSQGIKEIEN